jgi:hypothetical protein
MGDFLVDLTIAVHTSTRPIARAVASVLEGNTTPVRVNVVAHNIEPEAIRRNLGALAADPRVRLLHLRDGIPSPAGPLNLGLSRSESAFVSVMGSDDELESGAIDSWVTLQRRTGASMVIARIRHAGGGTVASPPARPFRRRGLDPVKDRLSYRSAPLGLISRREFGSLRFAEGLRSGEDLPFVTRLWFSGRGIAFDRTGPAYLVHGDEADRVTTSPKPVKDDFAFLDEILDDPRLLALDRHHREALVVMLMRTHVFDAVLNRSHIETWPPRERSDLALVSTRILAWVGTSERLLSIADRAALDAILDVESPTSEMVGLVRRRSRYRTPAAILTQNPLFLLHRQAPLRTLAAGYLVGRT